MQNEEFESIAPTIGDEGAADIAGSEGTNDTSATAPAAEEDAAPADTMEGESTEDFALREREDLAALAAALPDILIPRSLGLLANPVRYGELREAGLSPLEAYLATEGRRHLGHRTDNRRHLRSAIGRTAGVAGERISSSELSAARDLFPSLSDGEIEALWRRVGDSRRA